MYPVWLNGELLTPDTARVDVFDHGLTVGDGVFETMRTEGGVPFAMTRHLRRLRRSLAGLGLTLDRDDDELRDAMVAVAAALPGPGKVRLTVTAGRGPAGSGRAAPGEGAMTTYITADDLDPWPLTGAAITVPWRRNEHSPVAGLKTTSYAENVVALSAAKDAGADEALFANTAGDLCEGTGSNVFVVLGDEVVTPPLSSGCLAGVTRALVVEHGGVNERPLPLSVLAEADEVFLTSSTRDVQGLHRVDDRTFDAPGPHTARLAAAFAALAAADVDP